MYTARIAHSDFAVELNSALTASKICLLPLRSHTKAYRFHNWRLKITRPSWPGLTAYIESKFNSINF
jgi:hypothetical protein